VRMATLMALYELLIVQRLCPDDLAQSVHRRRSAGWFLWSVHYQLAGGLGYWRSDFEAFVDLLYAWLPYCTYAQAQDGLNRQSEDALRRFLSEDPNLSQQEVSDACDIATLKLYRDLWEQPAVWREVVGFLESQRRTDGE
jgi:hypothetical protein